MDRVDNSAAPELRDAIDRLAAVYTAAPWSEERERARNEYDAARGSIYEDDELFEAHLAGFLEWYLLERPLAGGEPPVRRELRGEPGPAAGERELWRALALGHRSLFEVVDVLGARREAPKARARAFGSSGATDDGSELLLADLIRGGLWRVEQDPPLDGVDPGDVFEARLVPWRGGVRFGPTFCFHPRSARDSIHALLRRAEEEGRLGPALVATLATMRLKHDRFRNIAVEHIYSELWRRTSREGPGDAQ
jgi:hypothetical protein